MCLHGKLKLAGGKRPDGAGAWRFGVWAGSGKEMEPYANATFVPFLSKPLNIFFSNRTPSHLFVVTFTFVY